MVMRFTADKPGMQNLTFSYSPNTEAQGKIEADGTNGLCYAGKLNNNQMKFVPVSYTHLLSILTALFIGGARAEKPDGKRGDVIRFLCAGTYNE